MSYFEQTKMGESRWWSWVAVTWLAYVSWMLLQSILLLPVFLPLLDSLPASVITEQAQNYNRIALLTGVSATLAALLIPVISDEKPRNICGVLLVFAITIVVVFSKMGSDGGDTTEITNLLTELMGNSPLVFTLFLLTFPAGLIGLYLGQKFIHKRTLTALHTAAKRFRWVRVFQGFFLTWIVLGATAFIANVFGLIEVDFIFSGGTFWIYAFVSLLFIPFQAATEEIVFRGYFNQGLTHLLRYKWIAFAITSFAFMALHLANPEALEGAASGTLPIVMSGYFFFGFAMCLVVWLDDGLETAIGIHAGNNCFAAVIMNYENSVLPTPSIFLTGTHPVKDVISTIIVLSILVGIIWIWRGRPKTSAPS